MLRTYWHHAGHLVVIPSELYLEATSIPVWHDLINPTPEEDRSVEHQLGISIPTREEMEDIELSARLYQESGAEFMTMTALTGLDGDDPVKTPVTFILKGSSLVTVRYAEPKPFDMFLSRAQRSSGGGVPCANGEMLMTGLIEALIDRLADTRAARQRDRWGFAGGLPQQDFERDKEDTRSAIDHRTHRSKSRFPDGDPRKPGQHLSARRLSRGAGEPGTQADQGDPATYQAAAAGCRVPGRSRQLPVRQDQLPARRDPRAHQS